MTTPKFVLLKSRPTKLVPELQVDVPKETKEPILDLSKKGLTNRAVGKSVSMPPPLQIVPSHRKVFRYKLLGEATATRNVTVQDLLLAPGVIATIVNSTAVGIASSVRVRRIALWGAIDNSSAQGITSEIYFNALAGDTKEKAMDTTTPLGTTITTGQAMTPPKNSLAAFWHTSLNNSQIVFTVRAPQGSVLDLDIEWTQPNELAPTSMTGITSVALGTFFYPYLDWNGTGSGAVIAPSSLPSRA